MWTSILPFVFVDNLIEAIIIVLESHNSNGKVYNVVDPEIITKKEYLELLFKRLYPKAHYINIPYWLLYTAVYFQDLLTRILGRKPFLTRYRLTSSQRNIIYDASRIQNDLRWTSSVSIKDAINGILEYEQSKR